MKSFPSPRRAVWQTSVVRYPIELAKLGHDVTVIMPAYRKVRQSGQEISDTGIRFEVPIGSQVVEGRYLRSHLPGSDVPVYLVDQPRYFDREELYRETGRDYKDNCERFVFFCRAAMESIRLLGLNVDLIHANDWQTGLIPAFQKIEYENAPGYEQIATLLTIHNMAYQGQFWHWDMLLTGLDWKYFNWRQMEYYGDLNLLKTGIVFADSLNTVSPRYAEEIQQSPLGMWAWKESCRTGANDALGDHQRRRLFDLESRHRSAPGGQLCRERLATGQGPMQGRSAGRNGTARMLPTYR